jgi:hypothetical protein
MVGDGKELLKQAILGLARRLSPRLESLLVANPDLLDQFLDAVVASIRTETRAALSGLPRLQEAKVADAVGRVAAGVDQEALMNRVSAQLGERLSTWFEKDAAARTAFGAAVAQEFMKHLDLEEFAQEVADQVSAQVSQRVSIILPPS